MSIPKVSVIIPVYNVEKYLRQCLDSVINQTLKDIEIICVNDDSPDNSLEILNEYAAKDSRIKVFSKENEGLGAASARNLGLDNATGEYLSVLDSDDFFDLEMLEKSYNKAKATNADVVVFSGYDYDDATGNVRFANYLLDMNILTKVTIFSKDDYSDKILQITRGAAWNKLFRRNFIEKNQLRFQRVKLSDDAYFTYLSMVLAQRIAVLPEYLYYYRINTGTSQVDGISNYPDSECIALKEIKNSLVEYGVFEKVKKSFVNLAALELRFPYDRVNSFSSFLYLHNKYKNEYFELFDITDKPKDYFYDKRVYDWCQLVLNNSASEIAFRSARAYGSVNTTAILRFELPKEKIPQGCKLAILGSNMAAKFYYAQILLSEHCDVVAWVDKSGSEKLSNEKKLEDLKNIEFDYVLITYTQQKIIDETKAYLKSIGISEGKIILSDI